MKKYNCIVFDFDGTLADTKEGVLNSISYALSKIDYDFIIDERMVGPSPYYLYTKIIGLSPRQANKCVKNHRKYGDKKGYKQSRCYKDTKITLENLKKDSICLYIVSSKKHSTLKKVAKYLELAKFFNGIYGIKNEKDDKARLIGKMILKHFKKSEVLYVGDTDYDFNAAKRTGIDFCFAEYGYGKVENGCFRIANIHDLIS